MSRRWLHVLGLLVWCWGTAGCQRPGGAAKPGGAAQVPVEVLRIARQQVRPTARAVANVLAGRDVVLASEAAGRIKWLAAEPGTRVKAGQLLARLDAAKSGDNLVLVAAQRRQAKARLEIARRDLERSARLAQRNAISRAQLDHARDAVQLAEADLQAADARRKLTGRAVSDSRIVAPFDGIVAARHVELGELLTPGRPVLRLFDLSQVKIKAGLSAADAARVKVGDACSVRIESLRAAPFAAKVATIDAAADPRTRRVGVEAVIDNDGQRIKPGLLAEVTFFVGPARAVLQVPADAIVEQFDLPYAFVVVSGRAVRRRVEVGRGDGVTATVRKGLAPGDQLVIVGQEGLADGTPIKVVRTRTSPSK